MAHYKIKAAFAGVALCLTAGVVGYAAPLPADFVASSPIVTVPDETPTKAEAERWYVTHRGPSLAWTMADADAREAAEAAYLGEYGSWNNGCRADLHHSYQGTADAPTWVQAGLPVNVISGDVLLGEFVEGVCN